MVVSKKNTELNQEDVNEIFQEVESVLNSNEIYTKCELLKNNLIKDIENFAQSLIEKINEMKEKKKEEIEKMFENLDFFINTTKEQIKSDREAGVNIRESVEEEFETVLESTDTIFGYDLSNEIEIQENEAYESVMEEIDDLLGDL